MAGEEGKAAVVRSGRWLGGPRLRRLRTISTTLGTAVGAFALTSGMRAGAVVGAVDGRSALGPLVWVSVGAQNTAGWGSFRASIAADGRTVVFSSEATGLVPGDRPQPDVFRRDLTAGRTTKLVHAGAAGAGNPSITPDGRFVALYSFSSTLVAGDTNDVPDAFVKDMRTGVVERVSVDSHGGQANDASGGVVVDPHAFDDLRGPAVSADGRFVAFESLASNLVVGDTNRAVDVFVHDRQTGVTERVSVVSDGSQAARFVGAEWFGNVALTPDGRYVAFRSAASNLVVGDTNRAVDVFVHDRQTGVTERVSVASDGTQGRHNSYDPRLSADGRYVLFTSDNNNLDPRAPRQYGPYPYLRDRRTNTTQLVSFTGTGVAASQTLGDDLSADGRYACLTSADPKLTGAVYPAPFLRDLATGTMTRLAPSGLQCSLSSDARNAVFVSALPLVSDDTNEINDVYLRRISDG